MGSPLELSLDCKPQSYSLLLKSFGEQSDQTQKLEDFLFRLEEERIKIDAFKRELPLCMQLLTDAVEASRQQLHTYRTNQGPRPVLEEFIPLKHSNSEGSDMAKNISEKASLMTSVQLWSQSNDGGKQQSTVSSPKESSGNGFFFSPKLDLDNKQRNGGAFLPFSKERTLCPSPSLPGSLPDLALATSQKEIQEKKFQESDNGMSCSRRDTSGKGGGGASTTEQGKDAANNPADTQPSSSTTQTHRKARRCWSPDLHRRFVNALQMLGGSQVATPKQIRELMKVDGLTNDEVKSHLQKYRLHTRRPTLSPQAAGAAAPQLVVLGSIWVPPEYATAAAAAHSTAPAAIYGAHPASHASSHYITQPPVPQEFYPAPAIQLHPNLHQHPHHVYEAPSRTHSSPESDVRGAGNRSESIEDGKSESNSWKGDSGCENGGERKGLASFRDEGEESNGSEITLKF